MARANKYASLNFNDIYDKKNNKTLNTNNPTSSSLNKPKISNSHIHGNMLVLTRPTLKPISSSLPSQAQAQQPITSSSPVNPDPTRLSTESDSISLRPLGTTGGSASAAGVSRLPRDLCFVSPKPDKFVPPHLRPGYVCKEEKPVSPVNNRPKSGGGGGGGGYDRMRRGNTTAPDFVFRPGYTRPNSSG